VKPGRAVWKYLDGGGQSLEDIKQFSRWAGELGFEYQVIEGFWTRWSDDELRELVEYSRSQGVGLWFWRHSKELRSPESREEFFSRLHDLGVVGAKIDFLDHEHKEVVDLYRALLEDAARHQIMDNFHGANKPTGESRTWPNELTREALRGMEARRLNERARHDVTLPFTRYLAGPGDYTPVVFGDRRGDTTWAHQIATAVVFDQPLLTYGGHPESLLASPAVNVIKAIPSVWDETIVLPGSEVGEVAAFARRSGSEWFLAILNGPERRTKSFELSFLGNGHYQSHLVVDGEKGPASVRVVGEEHVVGDAITIEMPSGGGFVAHFVPQLQDSPSSKVGAVSRK
jgi:alpha-glucosidase